MLGGSSLRAVYKRRRVALLRTSNRGQSLAGIAPGDRAAKARRLLGRDGFRAAGARVLKGPNGRRRRALAGIGRKRVRWVAIAAPGAARRTARLVNRTR